MKVVFSTDSIKYPLTGIGRYTYELARELQNNDDISELLFLQGGKISRDLPIVKTESSVASGLKTAVKNSAIGIELYHLSATWLKSMALSSYKDSVYHSTNFYLPPRVDNAVATFHDLSIFKWPQCHPQNRVQYMKKELLLTLKRAKVLITDSEFTRKELAEYFDYPIEKIVSAPLASNKDFYPRDDVILQKLMTKLGLTVGQYTLFTGTIEPRKNIATLLDAYERLPQEIRTFYPLVICGFPGWNSEALHRRFELATQQGWLLYLGYLSSDDLPLLFSGARTFLFPSLYEGFGLPVLEAMASGVPVVCSNAASLPEVLGESGLMCDALDVEGLTAAIIKSLEDENWRNNAIAAGLSRANTFSWKRCAQETIKAYRQV
ncbi:MULTISPECIES: glycosyltransferase family 4 protein [Yersinia]|uniref:Glycosyltransferase family 1 protein n=3 Tax=Yersinia bercovieri TaxID=634 RepID=A0A2G4U539_YERBE|nr:MULTISPECIES: glycosyltransferase family 1 protein [Yersinia]EEQ05667.1 Glycosyl transferase group 1 [Yersinia bercovieri ATCC 43970]MCB5301441.1 glycosyltransferase family 4 protein [Yersinia bercovieri]MDN0101764.1 glycosyltransferase family 1 protein [Yersinia bercovieri]PHZ28435.1 glycosyltransferase family 1 protein [Yersinia bercovieri]QDW34007.1 glycosyltransferase family 4 protein [Yersinia sp. KBS0713]